jgi:D-serine deaminase-like pyridoxal phosphate-dependent protein
MRNLSLCCPFKPSTDLKMAHSPFNSHPSPTVLPTPAAVIDLSLASANCNAMLTAVSALSVSFPAHVKTHKTSQLTCLQVGESSKDVRLIISTVIEAEQLLPLLHDYILAGAKVNVLYGVPLGPSSGQGW